MSSKYMLSQKTAFPCLKSWRVFHCLYGHFLYRSICIWTHWFHVLAVVIMLPSALEFRYIFDVLIWFSSDIDPEAWFLCHLAILFYFLIYLHTVSNNGYTHLCVQQIIDSFTFLHILAALDIYLIMEFKYVVVSHCFYSFSFLGDSYWLIKVDILIILHLLIYEEAMSFLSVYLFIASSISLKFNSF